MRKIRKPTNINENKTEEKQADTLLTIPPLLLGSGEFTLSSCSYLMTSDLKVKNDQQNDDNNGKILFSDFKTDKSECSSSGLKAKKRRVDNDDSDSDSSSSSSDSDQSDDDLDKFAILINF